MQRSLRSLLRLRLRCPVLRANHLRLFGRTGDFPRLQPTRNSPLLSVERLTCGSPDRKATFAYAHSNSLRSLLEDLSQRTRELWKVSCESSPASAGVELTAPFCLANRLTALRAKRQESALIKSPSSLILSICHFPSFLSYVLLLCSGVTFFMISSTNIGLYIVL